MANQRVADCHSTGQNPLERVKYFRRQLLTEADMTTDQDYFRQKHRRHNRFLHGWGTVCGLEVVHVQGLCVEIQPGYALGPYGDEIFVTEPVRLDLATCGGEAVTDPCEPSRIRGATRGAGRQTVYVAIRYAECLARPVRAMPAGCGCKEEVCEYSRIRDSFEIACLDQLPVSHLPEAAMRFCELLETRQVIPCPSCPEDPWIVLATIKAPDGEISTESISYMNRRQILSTAMLQEWLYACCCERQPRPTSETLRVTAVKFYDNHWEMRGKLFQDDKTTVDDDGNVTLALSGQGIQTIQVIFNQPVDVSTVATFSRDTDIPGFCSFLVECVESVNTEHMPIGNVVGSLSFKQDNYMVLFTIDPGRKHFPAGTYKVTLKGTEDQNGKMIKNVQGSALNGEIKEYLPSGDEHEGGNCEFWFEVENA